VSVERLALGCLMPGFPGLEAPDWILRRVEHGLGGVVLFAWNVGDREQVARLTASLGDVVVATDEEGGDVTRLESATGSSFPGNLVLGALDDAALTEQVAAAIAHELAAVGVTMNLAPVADVNTNPSNPVIGVRSFGHDPALVARHVAAFARGTQAAGVAACAKHFPGHGDTSVDSHLDLPVVHGDLGAALLPFRAAVDAGVSAVMTAHLVVPELDDAPATLSRRVLTELLREELGFGGAIVTDALEMRAISGRLGFGAAAVSALAAGADALCLGHDSTDEHVEEIVAATAAAVRSGDLREERLAEAAGRLAATRLSAAPAPAARRDLGADAARRALLVSGNPSLDAAPLVVELVADPSIAAGPSGYTFADAVRAQWPGAEVVRASTAGAVAADVARAGSRRTVVVTRDAIRRPAQRAAVNAALAQRTDTIVVETGVPGWRPERGAYVATLGAARVNLDAAVERLATRSPVAA
jgi:beta-N-acetylhexosaminidase